MSADSPSDPRCEALANLHDALDMERAVEAVLGALRRNRGRASPTAPGSNESDDAVLEAARACQRAARALLAPGSVLVGREANPLDGASFGELVGAFDASRRVQRGAREFLQRRLGLACLDGVEDRRGCRWGILRGAILTERAPMFVWEPIRIQSGALRVFGDIEGHAVYVENESPGVVAYVFDSERRDDAFLASVDERWRAGT